MFRFIVLCVSLALFAPTIGHAKRLAVSEFSSNSVLRDAERGLVYGAELMRDEQVGTMWVEGEGSAGLGKYIEVKFESEVTVAQIRIWGGCFLDKEYWERHNRVRAIELKYPDFTSERLELKDTMEAQWLKLAEPKTLTKLKIYLRSVYEGNTWNDTAISEVQFFDKAGPEEFLEGVQATASSEYKDEQNTYSAAKAVDGWLDTHWVEGVGSGDGEYLDLDLGTSRSLKAFAISMGNDGTESFFKGSNRASSVRLSFSDGSSQQFQLEDRRGLQRFDLRPVTAKTVRVAFTSIVKGSSNSDLYIGEVRLWD